MTITPSHSPGFHPFLTTWLTLNPYIRLYLKPVLPWLMATLPLLMTTLPWLTTTMPRLTAMLLWLMATPLVIPCTLCQTDLSHQYLNPILQNENPQKTKFENTTFFPLSFHQAIVLWSRIPRTMPGLQLNPVMQIKIPGKHVALTNMTLVSLQLVTLATRMEYLNCFLWNYSATNKNKLAYWKTSCVSQVVITCWKSIRRWFWANEEDLKGKVLFIFCLVLVRRSKQNVSNL